MDPDGPVTGDDTPERIESEPAVEPPAEAESPAEPALEPEPAPAADDLAAPVSDPGVVGRWRLVTLVPHNGQEPPATQRPGEAQAIWAAVTAPWHPALLASASELPRIEHVEYPDHPYADEVRITAAGADGWLPPDYRMIVADVGAVLIEGEADREACIRQLLGCLPGAPPPGEAADPLVQDFLALGAAWWWLRDLTTAMNHPDGLDHESLRREVLAGARAWAAGDPAAVGSRLRAAFELLTQARERFYPVDAYVLDLALLDPAAPPGTLADALEARVPVSFLGPARAVEALAGRDPERLELLRLAIEEGWADVVGGAYGEPDEPLRPVESILWQFRRGAETYRRFLDDRTAETLARRRFGLYPQLPQIARRFGFRFALHMGFDDGRFPVPPEAKRLWQAPDGSQLEALTRLPIAADDEGEATRIAWRLGRSMKEDHVATLGLVHWPDRVAGWYRDLRRVAAYSPVLARWATLSDYFHLTDRPYETYRPELDAYGLPYLEQAVGRRDPTPISRRVVQAGLRTRFDAVAALAALTTALNAAGVIAPEEELPPTPGPEATDGPPAGRNGQEATGAAEIAEAALRAAEDALESGRLEEAAGALDRLERQAATRAAQAVASTAPAGRPGFLVLNPLGIARQAVVRLPEGTPADLRPEGPLQAAQLVDDGVQAVVDLPAFGYAWIPRDVEPERSPPPGGGGGVKVKGRVISNESMEVEIDEATGGIRSLRAPGEPLARLGQQLVIGGLRGPDGSAAPSRMRAARFEVEYAGPALVQALSEGTLHDPADDRTLGRFRQRLRLWHGRPILEVEIALSDLDAGWLGRIAAADPWAHFLSCRWAWPDPDAELRRTSLLAPERTTADRPETPDALDITTHRNRTAILFGGLAHHRRHGPRMLDTLLIAGRESARTFRLGVALDQEYPHRAEQDFSGPQPAVVAAEGPPGPGPAGWFFALDHRSVAVTHVEPIEPAAGAESARGLIFHLLETTGRAARCRLRLLRGPASARQTDFFGETLLDLSIDGDAVQIDLTPHELARVEIILG